MNIGSVIFRGCPGLPALVCREGSVASPPTLLKAFPEVGAGCCSQAPSLWGTPHFPPCPFCWSPAGPSAVGHWVPPHRPPGPCRPFPLITRSGFRLLRQPRVPCESESSPDRRASIPHAFPPQVCSGGFSDLHRCSGVSDSWQMLSVETFT